MNAAVSAARVTWFDSCREPVGTPIRVDEALARIADAPWDVRDAIAELRGLRESGADDKAIANYKAATLPAFAWGGVFKRNRRKNRFFATPSGLAPLDVDDDPDRAADVLTDWPHTYAVWRSVSGRIHGLARVAIDSPADYRRATEGVRAALCGMGLTPDATVEPARLLFASSSPITYGEGAPYRPPPVVERAPRRFTRSNLAFQQAFRDRQRLRGSYGGLASARNRRGLSTDRDRWITALVHAGMSVRGAAVVVGVGLATVQRAIARRLRPSRDEDLFALLMHGATPPLEDEAARAARELIGSGAFRVANRESGSALSPPDIPDESRGET